MASAPRSNSLLATASIESLAILRMMVGGSTLLAPRFTYSMLGIPMTTEAVIFARLFGVRDFVLGGLLWTAFRKTRTSTDTKDGKVADLVRALRAGAFVDAVDVFSCVVGVLDGALNTSTVALLGGGAAFFVGLGLLGLRG